MRQIKNKHILLVLVCLAVTGLLILMQPAGRSYSHDRSLMQSFSGFAQWRLSNNNQLSPAIIDALKLDDFVFQTYQKGSDRVDLYIGYYLTGKKIGAAHDPQVCYPGQGWKLSGKQERQRVLSANSEISWASIKAELNGRIDLIYYWFQVDDEAVPNTLKQKLLLFKNKLLEEGKSMLLSESVCQLLRACLKKKHLLFWMIL